MAKKARKMTKAGAKGAFASMESEGKLYRRGYIKEIYPSGRVKTVLRRRKQFGTIGANSSDYIVVNRVGKMAKSRKRRKK